MRNIRRVFTIFVASLVGAALVNAQSAGRPNEGARGSDRPPAEAPRPRESGAAGASEPGPGAPERFSRFISYEMSYSGKVVKRAPYSAETLTENTQILNNGTSLTRRTMGMVYRDDEGRTRREMSAIKAGPFATSGDALRMIVINDPVAGVSSTIMPDSDITFTKTLSASGNNEPPEAKVSSDGGRTESLGKEVIEGFVAEGTRTTNLIPAGRIGNDKAIEIVHERWYSPELQVILLSKHNDPRWGETVYRLRNISRGAPDNSLFSLPANSTPKEKKTRPRQ